MIVISPNGGARECYLAALLASCLGTYEDSVLRFSWEGLYFKLELSIDVV